MGKSWKQNARNDKWRKQKQRKLNKGQRHGNNNSGANPYREMEFEEKHVDLEYYN